MKQRKKIISSIFIIAATMIMTTGCASDMVAYLRREDPAKAMEKYLEEKYDDDVTLISEDIEQSYRAFWNKSSFGAIFESENLNRKKIRVAAYVTKDKKSYVFRDDYQRTVHLIELDEILKEVAPNYLNGEYLVKAFPEYDGENEDVKMMDITTYTNAFKRLGVCVVTKGVTEEDALSAAKKIEKEIVDKGIRCSWVVGLIETDEQNNEISIEESLTLNGEFSPWNGNDIRWFVQKDFDEEWEWRDE